MSNEAKVEEKSTVHAVSDIAVSDIAVRDVPARDVASGNGELPVIPCSVVWSKGHAYVSRGFEDASVGSVVTTVAVP